MTIEYKVDEQTARAELEALAESLDVDLEVDDTLDEKDRKESQKNIETVIKAIRKGHITIANGEATFTPQRSNGVAAITFREATGSTLLAADKFGDKQKMHKMYAMISEMTGVEPPTFSKLKKSDLMIVLAVAAIFLG